MTPEPDFLAMEDEYRCLGKIGCEADEARKAILRRLPPWATEAEAFTRECSDAATHAEYEALINIMDTPAGDLIGLVVKLRLASETIGGRLSLSGSLEAYIVEAALKDAERLASVGSS